MKFCKDCKFFLDGCDPFYGMPSSPPYCLKFPEPVKGRARYSCAKARMEETLCGDDAKHFESAPPKPVPEIVWIEPENPSGFWGGLFKWPW